MAIIDTTRVRQRWVEDRLKEFGTLSSFAEKMGVSPATASRWIEPEKDATPRFIGAVLNNFPINFDDAFITVREEIPEDRVRLRRRRVAA